MGSTICCHANSFLAALPRDQDISIGVYPPWPAAPRSAQGQGLQRHSAQAQRRRRQQRRRRRRRCACCCPCGVFMRRRPRRQQRHCSPRGGAGGGGGGAGGGAGARGGGGGAHACDALRAMMRQTTGAPTLVYANACTYVILRASAARPPCASPHPVALRFPAIPGPPPTFEASPGAVTWEGADTSLPVTSLQVRCGMPPSPATLAQPATKSHLLGAACLRRAGKQATQVATLQYSRIRHQALPYPLPPFTCLHPATPGGRLPPAG